MLVEDEIIVAMDIRQRLEKMGYEVVAHAISGDEAVRYAKSTKPNLILMDIKIKGPIDGIETASAIHESQNIPVVYVTAYSDEGTLKRARVTEAFGYLIKPFEDRELRSVIEIAIYKHEMETKLRESEEQNRKIIETSPDGIVTIDLNGNILTVNKKFVEMFGFNEPAEIIGHYYTDFLDVEEIALAAVDFQEILKEKNIPPFEYRGLRKDGSRFVCEIDAGCIHDLDNRVVSIIVVARDISERKSAEEKIQRLNAELEERVASRTASLEASNRELEAFSYSVAHDLRTPLRTIISFSQIFLDDYSQILDAKGIDYLHRILNSARNMAKLIDDLLKLSRITRAEMKRVNFNLATTAQNIFHRLQSLHPDRKVQFSIGECPNINADPVLIEAVLENLIGNAWKFTSKSKLSRIEVGSIHKEGKNIFFVKDNGIGFDMAYHEKLFEEFHRLHNDSDFEGNGIGLSIVKRIIMRHSGRVWAESETGKGATFYFTVS